MEILDDETVRSSSSKILVTIVSKLPVSEAEFVKAAYESKELNDSTILYLKSLHHDCDIDSSFVDQNKYSNGELLVGVNGWARNHDRFTRRQDSHALINAFATNLDEVDAFSFSEAKTAAKDYMLMDDYDEGVGTLSPNDAEAERALRAQELINLQIEAQRKLMQMQSDEITSSAWVNESANSVVYLDNDKSNNEEDDLVDTSSLGSDGALLVNSDGVSSINLVSLASFDLNHCKEALGLENTNFPRSAFSADKEPSNESISTAQMVAQSILERALKEESNENDELDNELDSAYVAQIRRARIQIDTETDLILNVNPLNPYPDIFEELKDNDGYVNSMDQKLMFNVSDGFVLPHIDFQSIKEKVVSSAKSLLNLKDHDKDYVLSVNEEVEEINENAMRHSRQTASFSESNLSLADAYKNDDLDQTAFEKSVKVDGSLIEKSQAKDLSTEEASQATASQASPNEASAIKDTSSKATASHASAELGKADSLKQGVTDVKALENDKRCDVVNISEDQSSLNDCKLMTLSKPNSSKAPKAEKSSSQDFTNSKISRGASFVTNESLSSKELDEDADSSYKFFDRNGKESNEDFEFGEKTHLYLNDNAKPQSRFNLFEAKSESKEQNKDDNVNASHSKNESSSLNFIELSVGDMHNLRLFSAAVFVLAGLSFTVFFSWI